MKKWRLTGSDQVPVQFSAMAWPSLWMYRVSKLRLFLPAARGAHLVAGVFEIIGMDEFHRAVSDHLSGIVADNGQGARADLNEIACGVGGNADNFSPGIDRTGIEEK